MVLQVRKSMLLFYCLTLLASVWTFFSPGVTHGEEKDDVLISTFSYRDYQVDKVSRSKTEKDGYNDLHFKLILDIQKLTKIDSIVIRELYNDGGGYTGNHWTTMDTSWFLGVYQNGKPLLSQGKPEGDSLGSFKGFAVLDLYLPSIDSFEPGAKFDVEVNASGKVYEFGPIEFTDNENLINPLAIGGQGIVTVTDAVPNEPVTLAQMDGDEVNEIEAKDANNKGEAVFTGLSVGKGYYAFQNIDGLNKESNQVNVYAAPELINSKSIKSSAKLTAGKFSISVSGKVLDKKVSKVTVSFGSTSSSVSVKNGSFSWKKTIDAKKFGESIKIYAKTSSGLDQTITLDKETDFVDDESLEAEVEQDNFVWTFTGFWNDEPADSVYAIVKGKIVQVKDLKSNDGEFTFTAEAGDVKQNNIVLVFSNKQGKFEAIPLPMPTPKK